MLTQWLESHRAGKLDEAEQGYRGHLLLHPDDAHALHLLGVLRQQRGDPAEAAQLLGRAHALAPEQPATLLALGGLAFQRGDARTARDQYERALALDPNLPGAHAALGQLALGRGETTLAEQHFRTALRVEEDAHAHSGLSAVALSRGETEIALRHAMRAAELEPNDAMIQFTLGNAFVARGTPAFAERAYANAIALRPDFGAARAELGQLLIRSSRPAEAEAQFRELAGAPGFDAIAELGLADTARAQNKFDEAITLYRRALARNPVQPLAAQALAWSLASIGRIDEAFATYDAYLAIKPDERSVLAARADLLMLFERLAESAAAWRELQARDVDSPIANMRLAVLLERLGDFDGAIAHAERVPTDPEALLVRIRACLRAGDDAGARRMLDELGSRPMTVGQTRLHANYLGRLFDRAGHAVDAVAQFARAQSGTEVLWPELPAVPDALAARLAEPAREALPNAPIFLIGAPGSSVERVAALLADQPGLTVLNDRTGAFQRDDDFTVPELARYVDGLSDAEADAGRARYFDALEKLKVDTTRPVIDWLPRYDARFLAFVRRVLPGARFVVVQNDPRDALLNWLAFGWAPGFPCADADAGARWLARERAHVAVGADLADLPRLVVDPDALFADLPRSGAALARFVGVEALVPGAHAAAAEYVLGLLPGRFPPGHWRAYADALDPAFAQLDGRARS